MCVRVHVCVQGAVSDGEEMSSGTSELRDLEFKLFHNLADLQVYTNKRHQNKIRSEQTTHAEQKAVRNLSMFNCFDPGLYI